MLLMLNILMLLFEHALSAEKTSVHPEFISFIEQEYAYNVNDYLLIVRPSNQTMYLAKNGEVQKTYTISTSKYGLGQKAGSYKTPLGPHYIKQKIGDGYASGSVFRGRVFTGKVAEIVHEPKETNLDYVTTRILWLEGLKKGFNKGEGIDSYHRYIYIHGTHEEGLIGRPASHGCIRMLNQEVIELFELVTEGTFLYVLDERDRMIELNSPKLSAIVY